MIAKEMMIAINNARLYTLAQEEIAERTRAEIALKKAQAEIIHLEKEQNVVEGIEMCRKYQAFS